jgi:hypothetical protein
MTTLKFPNIETSSVLTIREFIYLFSQIISSPKNKFNGSEKEYICKPKPSYIATESIGLGILLATVGEFLEFIPLLAEDRLNVIQ